MIAERTTSADRGATTGLGAVSGLGQKRSATRESTRAPFPLGLLTAALVTAAVWTTMTIQTTITTTAVHHADYTRLVCRLGSGAGLGTAPTSSDRAATWVRSQRSPVDGGSASPPARGSRTVRAPRAACVQATWPPRSSLRLAVGPTRRRWASAATRAPTPSCTMPFTICYIGGRWASVHQGVCVERRRQRPTPAAS